MVFLTMNFISPNITKIMLIINLTSLINFLKWKFKVIIKIHKELPNNNVIECENIFNIQLNSIESQKVNKKEIFEYY